MSPALLEQAAGSCCAYRETAIAFACCADTLVGVLARPADVAAKASSAGVLVVVGGPQYRAGSHRQFTLLCRKLAAQGVPSLRFDVRGMGDSSGEPRGFDSLSDDIAAGVDALAAALPAGARIVLWGLCDGASAVLLYLAERLDPRVRGVCLLNPWVRTEQTLARTHVQHYYGRRLLQRDFWRKLLGGGVALAALRDAAAAVRMARRPASGEGTTPMDFRAGMLQGLLGFRGNVLLVLSGKDFTALEFKQYTAQSPAWQDAMAGARMRQIDLPGADHTLSNTADDRLMQDELVAWLKDPR